MLAHYWPILVFIFIAAVIAAGMIGGSLVAAPRAPYAEKLSAYECGFEAFDDARRRGAPSEGCPVPRAANRRLASAATSFCSANSRAMRS